jgi:outer membrane protein TolC
MDLFSSKGEFDPMLGANLSYSRAVQTTGAEYRVFGGISNISYYRHTDSAYLAGKLPTGTLYNVTMNYNADKSTMNGLLWEYEGGLAMTLTQPLLQGAGQWANWARIRTMRNMEEGAQWQVRLTVLTILGEVVKSYWDVVGANESLMAYEHGLENAQRLLDVSEKRLKIGAAASIEVLQAKAGVATRQGELVSARARIQDAEDLLKRYLSMKDGDVLSASRLLLTDRPNMREAMSDSLELDETQVNHSIELALANRPEMKTAEIEITTAEIERKRAGNNLKPQIDVVGGVTQGGRGYNAKDPIKGIDNLEDGIAAIPGGIRDQDDFAYNIGVKGSISIGNRAARGQYTKAGLNVRQSELRLEKTRQDLMLKVRVAARAVQTSRILVESNQETVALQQANVVAEEKRLRLGTSTSYRVLQVQQDLIIAETQLAQARISYEKALVDLRLAEGTLMENLGVEYESPAPERPVGWINSLNPAARR